MLRQALTEDLITKHDVLKYIGERFRIKLRLPDWYTDEEIGKFLFKQCICTHLSSEEDKFNILVYMTRKLFDFAKGRCAAESADNPMFQEVLLGGHLYLMVLKVYVLSENHNFCSEFQIQPLFLCTLLTNSMRGFIFEPPHEKTNNLYMLKTKMQSNCAVTAKVISAFVFATRIVQSFFFLNPKFQASSLLM